MAKQIVFADEARRNLKIGIDTLANAVKTTLGPKGRNVALDKKWGSPTMWLATAPPRLPSWRRPSSTRA